MPSVFPGIDPYLESQGLWPDFHVGFLAELRNAIADQLPEPYVARIDERMNLVGVPDEDVRRVRPDVAVDRHVSRASEPSLAPSPSGTQTLEPEIIPLKILEEHREVYIEILHEPEWRLVSVIELLSPANKTGEGRHDYLTKRNGIMRLETVHLIELDFLSAGRRLPMRWSPREGDYYAYIARAERRPDCEVYGWTVRDPLPPIPIPLLAPDPDIRIDLAPLFSSVYDRARYVRSIRYDAPLTIPLAPDGRAWAEGLARASRL
jgi:hypothetical protein